MPHAATDSADTTNTLRRVGIDALLGVDDFVDWFRAEVRACGGIGALCDKYDIKTGVSDSATRMWRRAFKQLRPGDWEACLKCLWQRMHSPND